jgi:hypothetical protein
LVDATLLVVAAVEVLVMEIREGVLVVVAVVMAVAVPLVVVVVVVSVAVLARSVLLTDSDTHDMVLSRVVASVQCFVGVVWDSSDDFRLSLNLLRGYVIAG